MMDGAQAQAEAVRLREQARQHKRLANQHRRRAREAMASLAELRDTCARLGIRLVEHPMTPSPGGGPSGNSQIQEHQQTRA